MKKVLPVFLMSLILLGGGIALSLIWGMKGGGFLTTPGTRIAEPLSAFSEFRYFLNQVLERTDSGIGKLLIQIMFIFPLTFILGAVAKRLGQPSVIGHIFAGLLLGPSFLGHFFPDTFQFFFPERQMAPLQLLGSLGVLMFMFLAGMEMDFKYIRQQTHAVILISHIGIFLPFFLGVQAASWLFRGYGEGVSYIAFALMMGISMSVTAFPVLVKMLQEGGLMQTPVGQLALSAAAVDDVTAWLILSVIIAVISSASWLVVFWTILFLIFFIVLILLVIKPLFKKWHQRFQPPEALASAVLLYILFFSAWTTEAIGIHAIFGAFMAGTVIPKESPLCEHLIQKLEYFCSVVLLPIFFVISGLRTHLDSIRLTDLPAFAVLLAVAVIGKWGGAWIAGRVAGLSNKESVLIGALMNTRGLMELIVLNIAYELGVFSVQIFSMLVMMALLTTAMTGPLIAFHKKRTGQAADVAQFVV